MHTYHRRSKTIFLTYIVQAEDDLMLVTKMLAPGLRASKLGDALARSLCPATPSPCGPTLDRGASTRTAVVTADDASDASLQEPDSNRRPSCASGPTTTTTTTGMLPLGNVIGGKARSYAPMAPTNRDNEPRPCRRTAVDHPATTVRHAHDDVESQQSAAQDDDDDEVNTMILGLRDDTIDYFDVEESVKRVVSYGSSQEVLTLLDVAFKTLVLHDDAVDALEKVRWATRMIEVYTAAAEATVSEANAEKRELLVAGPLATHVFQLAEDPKLLTKVVNRRLPEGTIERLVATRIFRTVLQVKYNSPACWLTYIWTFSWFCVAFAGYSWVAYELATGSTRGTNRPLLEFCLVYVGLSGATSVVVELMRILRLRANEVYGLVAMTSSDLDYWLAVCGLPRAWREDLWHWVDFAAAVVLLVVPIWTRILWSRYGKPPALHSRHDGADDGRYSPVFANVVGFGALVLWIKVLAFLKGVGLKYATFVQMLIKIVKDLKQFVIVLAVIFLAFTQVLYIRLGPLPSESYGFHDDGAPSPFRTFPVTLQSMYLLAFVGDLDTDAYPTALDKLILLLFIFVIVVVMLNVLIAIVCDSYNYAMATSVQLFWRSRLELMFEYENKHSLDSLLCRTLQPFRVTKESATQVLKAELLGDECDSGRQSDVVVGRVLDIVTRVDNNVQAEFVRLKRLVGHKFDDINGQLHALSKETRKAAPSRRPSKFSYQGAPTPGIFAAPSRLARLSFGDAGRPSMPNITENCAVISPPARDTRSSRASFGDMPTDHLRIRRSFTDTIFSSFHDDSDHHDDDDDVEAPSKDARGGGADSSDNSRRHTYS